MPIQVNKDGTGQIVIADWRGGLNLLDNPLSPQYPENMTPTATNVWATGDFLEKRPSRHWFPFPNMGFLAGQTANNYGSFSSILGGEDNFLGPGNTNSSGYSGTIRINTVVSASTEYLYFFQSCLVSGTPFVFMGRCVTSNFPAATSTAGLVKDAILTLTSSASFSANVTGGNQGTASAQSGAFIDSTLVNTANWAYMLTNVISRVNSTAFPPTNMAAPLQLISSGIGRIINGNGLVLSPFGMGALIPNLCPGPANTKPRAPTIVQLSDNIGISTGHFYVNFTYPPTYSASAVSGGLIQFNNATSNSAGVQTPLNPLPGVIVTAAPLILNNPVIFNNYIFIISSTNPNNIQWSALASGDVWPTNNILGVGQGVLDSCVTLVPFAGNLVIIKKKSMWLLSGNTFDPSNPTYTLQQIDTPPDFLFEYPDAYTIIMPPFIQNASNLWYTSSQLKIFAHNGIYTYFGGLKCDKLYEDKLIEPLIVSAKDVGQYEEYLSNYYGDTGVSGGSISLGTFNSNLLINYVKQNAGRPNIQLVKDFRGAWWGWNTIYNVGATAHEIGLGNYTIFENLLWSCEPVRYSTLTTATITTYNGSTTTTAAAISTGNSIVQHFGTATSDKIQDGGSNGTTYISLAISADYKTKIFDIGYGQFTKLYAYYTKQPANNLTIKWWIDGANSASAAMDMTVGSAAAGGLIKNSADINQVGHSIQYQIIQNDVDTNFQLARLEQKFKLIPDEEMV